MFFKYDILKQESPTSTRWIAAVRYIDHAQQIIAEQMCSNRCAYVIVDAESGSRRLVQPPPGQASIQKDKFSGAYSLTLRPPSMPEAAGRAFGRECLKQKMRSRRH